ncbi:MAG: hypothetical protein M0R03_08170 [Novosphingobium sp.]|nr:hypothetical protein [Novosphingobium sp.]
MIITGGTPRLTEKAYKLAEKRRIIEEVELCIDCGMNYFEMSYSQLDEIQKKFIKYVTYILRLKEIIFENFYEELCLTKKWTMKKFYETIESDYGVDKIEKIIQEQISIKENKHKKSLKIS